MKQGTGDRSRVSVDSVRRQEMGDRRFETWTGYGRQELGDGRQAMGDRRWETGQEK